MALFPCFLTIHHTHNITREETASSRGWREGQDLLRRVFRRDDDGRRRVARDHAGEDGGIHDEQVVCAVDLGVEINHGGAVWLAAVVGSNLGGAWLARLVFLLDQI